MNISKKILEKFGWKISDIENRPNKSVLCLAPHTSNWDFVYGKLFAYTAKIKASFLMKKSWFVFPIGYFMDAMGGVPIDRSKRMSITQQMIDEFNKRTKFHLAITPEGTRKATSEWKLGFYHIARGANVPIQLAFVDYKNKEMGVKEIFYPTDNMENDMNYIYNFYRKYIGKKPKNFIVP